MSKKYDLLIFDLDGTLVDSAPDIVATVKWLSQYYKLLEKDSGFIKNVIIGGARNILLECFGKENEKLIDSEMLDQFNKNYTERCCEKSVLYPKIKEVLSYYYENNKLLAVATYKTKEATEKILNTFGIKSYFDVVVTYDDVSNPKPNPECINKIIGLCNQTNEKTILIGDTALDFETARNADVDFCIATYGFETKEKIKNITSNYSVDLPEQIKTIVI